MRSRLQHGDENKEKGASLPRYIPSMAAVYTIIGINERHTGQACVLGPLIYINSFYKLSASVRSPAVLLLYGLA
jgi:hypothetical protein